jgi:hypothetical protein
MVIKPGGIYSVKSSYGDFIIIKVLEVQEGEVYTRLQKNRYKERPTTIDLKELEVAIDNGLLSEASFRNLEPVLLLEQHEQSTMGADGAADLYNRLQAVMASPDKRVERLTGLIPDLVRLFESAAAHTSPTYDPNLDNWLWTGRRPSKESEIRAKIVQLLGELGPDGAAAVPVLEAALRDFAVCRNYGSGMIAEQEHVCFHAACALGKIGQAGAPALISVRESQAICHRFFEPLAPPTGDITRLGELAIKKKKGHSR